MKKNFTLIGWAGFVITFILLLLQRNCGSNHVCSEVKSDTVTVEKWDTVKKQIPVPKPYPVPGKEVIVEIPAKVDTSAMLKDYYTKYYYEQTISDTNISATIIDTIFKNNIYSRKFEYRLLKPFVTNTIINNVTTQSPKIEAFLGGFASGEVKGENIGVGFSAALKTKKGVLYDAGYDVINNRASFGVLIKIGRKK